MSKVKEDNMELLKGFIVIFLIVVSIPILNVTLPTMDFTSTAFTDYSLNLPEDFSTDFNWSEYGTQNNTEILRFESIESFNIDSKEEWLNGTFTSTTPDSLPLGYVQIGYRNGTSGDDLLLYPRFDRASGTVFDYSGNDVDITPENNPTRGVVGVFSTNATRNDAQDEGYSAPGSAPLSDFGSSITLSSWVKPEQDAEGRILFKRNVFNLQRTGTGEVLFELRTSDGNFALQSTGNLQNDTWSHVLATYTGSSMRIYINGERNATASATGTIDQNTNNVFIGRDDNGGPDTLIGKIDEPRIHDISFNDNQVLQDAYHGGVPFQGSYESRVFEQSDSETDWDNLLVDASVPSGTSLTANFTALNGDNDHVYSKVFSVSDGANSFDISQDITQKGILRFDGESSNETRSWKVDSADIRFVDFVEVRLRIDNTSKSVTNDNTGDGVFVSPIQSVGHEGFDKDDSFFEIDSIEYASDIPPQTEGLFTIRVSDDNFSTVKDDISFEIQETILDSTRTVRNFSLERASYYRYRVFLSTNDSNENPHINHLNLNGRIGETEEYPTENFNITDFVILLMIGVGFILTWEVLFNREEW